MANPTFGQKLAATIRAELGLMDDEQEIFVANMIDREHAASQGKLDGFALEHSSPVRHGSARARQVLFDGLCGACGLQMEGMTHPMKRSVSVALTAIMAVMPTLTTRELIIRAREYRRKHPTWDLTPHSLAKHWSTCATRDSERGLLDEPADWRKQHHLIFPEADLGATGEVFARTHWEQIGRAYQEKIIRWTIQRETTSRNPHAD